MYWRLAVKLKLKKLVAIFKKNIMKKILVLGAGLSSSYLIKYLLQNASKEKWEVIVADTQLRLAQDKIGKSKFVQPLR